MRVDDSYRNATYYVVMQHIMLFCEMTKIPSDTNNFIRVALVI